MVEQQKDDTQLLLSVEDLDTFREITETKAQELKTVKKQFAQHQDKGEKEHKAVNRVIQDLVQILLGNIDKEDALKIFQDQYGEEFGQKNGEIETQVQDKTAQDQNKDSLLLRQLQSQMKMVQYSMNTLVLQNSNHLKHEDKVKEEQNQKSQQDQDLIKNIPASLGNIQKSLEELLEQSKKQQKQEPQVKEQVKPASDNSGKLEDIIKQVSKLHEESLSIQGRILEQLTAGNNHSHEKLDNLQTSLRSLGTEVHQKLDEIVIKQDQNKLLIQQSASLVEKIEQKQEIPQTIIMSSQMQQYKGENNDASYEVHQRIAQNIFDRKTEASWVNTGSKFTVFGKYSFAVMTQQDYVFVDGNQNNVDVLRKDDLSLIGQLKTDNNAVFSFLMQGLKVFVGCANNNLFVFEIDTLKRIKDIKSTSIVYCFHQLDYNTILCGQRDGHIQILQANNLGKIQGFSLKDTSHIIQVNKTFKQSEVIMACSRGLFFADIVDLGEYRLTLSDEVYFREQDIKAAIEYKRDQVATCIDMDLNVYIIDRKQRQCVKTIENPSGSDRPLCMRLIPNFDVEKMPFALIRDQEGLTLVNLKNPGAYKIFQSWYHQLPFPQMLLDCYKVGETGAVVCYVVEYTGKDSYIVKYELTGDFIGGLKMMAKNDM